MFHIYNTLLYLIIHFKIAYKFNFIQYFTIANAIHRFIRSIRDSEDVKFLFISYNQQIISQWNKPQSQIAKFLTYHLQSIEATLHNDVENYKDDKVN